MPLVNEQAFRDLLQAKLGASWDRAIRVYKDYDSKGLSFDVTNSLCYATDKEGKAEEVLDILEKESPNIKPEDVRSALNYDYCLPVFSHIYRDVLGFMPDRTGKLVPTQVA